MAVEPSLLLGRGPGAIIELVSYFKPKYIVQLGDVLSLDPKKSAASLLQLTAMGNIKVYLRTQCQGYFTEIPTTMEIWDTFDDDLDVWRKFVNSKVKCSDKNKG